MYACFAGITVHWADLVVYWTDYTLGHIMAFKPDGRYHRIILTDLFLPMGISIDPVAGLVLSSSLT